jgi:hypothetical protein
MKYKYLAYTFLLALTSTLTQAQVKIGNNPTTITPGALLDIEGATTHTVSLTNGNFGIGISNPITRLNIDGTLGFGNNPLNGQVGGRFEQLILNAGNQGVFINNSADTQPFVHVSSAGNVGIGVVNPITKLNIEGTLGFGNNGLNGQVGGRFEQLVLNTGNQGLLISNNGDTQAIIQVTNGGNVGIGVNPVAKLDVAGSVKITDGTQGTGRVLTSDANGLAQWKPLSGQTGPGFTAALAAGANFNINYNAGKIYPYPFITIAESGQYMAIVRTFAGASNASAPVAFYSFINRNGILEDQFEWYSITGTNNNFGVNGILFFAADAGDQVTVGFENKYQPQPLIQISGVAVSRNNIRIVKIN